MKPGMGAENEVLLVEDSAVYEKIITGHLRDWGFQVTVARNGEDAWAVLQMPNSPRLVIMDWVMPKMDGLELCQKIRSLPTSVPYSYILLMTGKDSRSDLLKAMDAGVDDYLVKPFDDLELKARLFAGRRVLLLQSELIDAHDKLQFVASHDSLTGVMNRREIIDALLREMARSKRERSPLAVAMVDVDHFKAVNDELGHLFGDHALKEVAQRLHAKLRVYDSVGRYGGEEFLLVFPGCDLTNMLVRMDEVRSFVSRSPLSAMGKHRLLTISIGVAVFDGETPIEVETLLHQADMSLYEAKRKGRNRVEYLEPQQGHAVPTPASSGAVFERTIQ